LPLSDQVNTPRNVSVLVYQTLSILRNDESIAEIDFVYYNGKDVI